MINAIKYDDKALRIIATKLGGTVSGYSKALEVIEALHYGGFHIAPHGDGVALTFGARLPDLFGKIAGAIRSGKLPPKPSTGS